MNRKCPNRIVHVQEDCDKWLSTTCRPKKQVSSAPRKSKKDRPKFSKPIARTYEIEFTSTPLEIKATKQTSIATFCQKKPRKTPFSENHQGNFIKLEPNEQTTVPEELSCTIPAPFPSLDRVYPIESIQDKNYCPKISTIGDKLTDSYENHMLHHIRVSDNKCHESPGADDEHSTDSLIYNDFDYVPSASGIREDDKENSSESFHSFHESNSITETHASRHTCDQFTKKSGKNGKVNHLISSQDAFNGHKHGDKHVLLTTQGIHPNFVKNDFSGSQVSLGDSENTEKSEDLLSILSDHGDSDPVVPVKSGNIQLLELELDFQITSNATKTVGKLQLSEFDDSFGSSAEDSPFTFHTQKRLNKSDFPFSEKGENFTCLSQECSEENEDSPFTFHSHLTNSYKTKMGHRAALHFRKHKEYQRIEALTEENSDEISKGMKNDFTFQLLTGNSKDGNLRKPTLHGELNVLRKPGLELCTSTGAVTDPVDILQLSIPHIGVENSNRDNSPDSIDQFTFHTQKRKKCFGSRCSSAEPDLSDEPDSKRRCQIPDRSMCESLKSSEQNELTETEECTDSQLLSDNESDE